MGKVESVRRRRLRAWLAVFIVAPTALLGVSACGTRGASQPAVLADKGSPYSDLLVPKLTATVQNGAVGVPVDQPVTVTVQGGVLGMVAMVDEAGESVPGDLSPDGLS